MARPENEDVFALNRDQSNYDIVLNISPSNANEVLIGGVRSYRSTNGGINFSQLNTTNTNLHGDDHALERNPLNGYLFLGDDGGIYRSTDNGLTWSNISLNLVIGEFYRLAGSQGNNELILCGAQDNGHFLRNSNNGLFNSVVSGFDAMDNIIDYSNSNIMYECIQNGGLGKSTNGGTSFIPVAVPDVGQWITPILQSPTLPNTIFYGSNSGILRSTNGGSSWVNIAGYNGAIALAISKLGNRLIASDGSQVKICNNPNAATPVWENEEYPGFYTYPISAIAVNPANADDIMVTFSGYEDRKVARSTDGGINWFNYTLNLPNIPVYSIAFANTNNNPSGATYIGTELGVFYKDDNQPGWEPFFNGLPRVPVTDIFVNYNSNDVTVATFGRGIWRSGGHASCPADLPLTGTIYGNKFFQAAATINSNQVVPATVGNSLKLRAGTTIRLTDGFKANEGSYFNAVNAGCGSGIALRPVSQKKNKPVKKLPIKKKTVTNRNKTEIKK